MLLPEGFKTPRRPETKQLARPDEPTGLLPRVLLHLLRLLEEELPASLPVRVYYKFDSGCWRCRNTRQLQKVYRCK